MSNYLVSDTDMTSVANAIRTKGGTSAQLAFPAEFVSAIGDIPTGGTATFELIGTYVFQNVAEYTNTSTSEEMDTDISVLNTDYAWGYVVITCDTPITTSNEWGMTVAFWGRYTSNGCISRASSAMQKGSATLSYAAMVSNSTGSDIYGVGILNNKSGGLITITRKCHSSACPKIRGGNYTVKVYGMTAF